MGIVWVQLRSSEIGKEAVFYCFGKGGHDEDLWKSSLSLEPGPDLGENSKIP